MKWASGQSERLKHLPVKRRKRLMLAAFDRRMDLVAKGPRVKGQFVRAVNVVLGMRRATAAERQDGRAVLFIRARRGAAAGRSGV